MRTRALETFLAAVLAACNPGAAAGPADAGGRDAQTVAFDAATRDAATVPILDAAWHDDASGAPDASAAVDASAAEDAAHVDLPDAAVPDADAPDADAPDADAPDADPPAGPDASRFQGCQADPPAGAPLPSFPAYGGTCPTLSPLPAENHLTSSGNDRTFKLVVPAVLLQGERLALVFVWYWLWGTADDLIDTLQLQQAADQQRIVFVVPSAKGDLPFRWPFLIVNSGSRLDEEIQFFDDMLACVVAAHPEVNPGCVSSLGISAGALFNDQLAPRRSDKLASFLSISGGVGTTARGWDGAARHLPAVVLWGGDGDEYNGLYNFSDGSKDLEDELVSEGEFFVECIHNCGHAVPPFDVPAGGTLFQSMWDFVLAHPYWVAPGTSPWQTSGFPAGFPGWCGMGKGSAVPRTGPNGC